MKDRFTFRETASGRTWADVDVDAIFSLLKQGLDDGLGAAEDAIRETYAVVTATIDSKLTQEQCLLPHHEVSDGTVTLNKAALVAAVAAVGEVPEEHQEAAKDHLRRHYSALEIELPASLAAETDSRGKNPVGTMVSLAAKVQGEMSVDDIPLASVVDLQSLMAGDEDPMEVVVEIPAGESTRGWNYTEQSIKDIVDHVNERTLNGFLGHQEPKNIETEFPTPVTHWVGAMFQNGSGYFRGVIDKAATDLKRWIRAHRVTQVSIFGIAETERKKGKVQVIGFRPLSIDWTPLDRAGMPTRIVSVGEMDSTIGDSLEELVEKIRTAAAAKLGIGKDGYCYIEQTFSDCVVVMSGKDNEERRLIRIPYTIENDEIKLGDPQEVVLKRIYEPVGGEMKMTLEELIGALNEKITTGEVTQEQLASEMGLVQGDPEAAEMLGRVKEVLGITGEMDIVEAATAAHNALVENRKTKHEAMIDGVLAEKVEGEMAQTIIRRMMNVDADATREVVAAEIDTLLADEGVKAAISRLHVDKTPPKGGADRTNSCVKTRRVAL